MKQYPALNWLVPLVTVLAFIAAVGGLFSGGSGERIPFTTLHGLYDRAAGFSEREPWNLSPLFRKEKGDLDLVTPYNFVSTADIVGGNSGSPVIDREGELVGLVFDGNMESLALDYFYTDAKARAIAVDARGLRESVEEVYGAGGLVEELLGGR